MFNFFPAVVFGGAKLCWAELNISKMWLTTHWCSVGQANICNSLWKILAFGWVKLDVAISGRGKGNSVATSSIKSQSLSNLRLSLINAFNVFNQATGKKAKAGEWLKGSPSGGGGKSVSQRDSSNSVKHFTYLHINWLKRKYTPGTRTQSQSFECVNMAKWQKGRKGPGLLLAAFALTFACLAISLSQLGLFLFGNFWHFKCVWLFSFWSANCEVIHWLSSGSDDALTTSMHTLSRWSPALFPTPFSHTHSLRRTVSQLGKCVEKVENLQVISTNHSLAFFLAEKLSQKRGQGKSCYS